MRTIPRTALGCALAASAWLAAPGAHAAPFFDPTLPVRIKAEVARPPSAGASVVLATPAADISPAAAIGVSLASSLLFSGLEKRALQNEVEFLVAVEPAIGGFDLADAVRAEVRSLQAPLQQGTENGPGTQVTLVLRHGLVGEQSPVFTPKVVAALSYADAGGREVLKQRAVFYGIQHSLFGGFDALKAWWGTDARYRRFLKHAARAVALHVLWTIRDDPSTVSPNATAEVQRLASEVRWLDTTSEACAFEAENKPVAYRGQRRQINISLAALCEGNPLLAGDPSAPAMVWVMRP